MSSKYLLVEKPRGARTFGFEETGFYIYELGHFWRWGLGWGGKWSYGHYVWPQGGDI